MTQSVKRVALIVAAVFLAAVAASTLTSSAPTASRAAASSPRFLVEVDGVALQGVQSVSGLSAETNVIEFTDGSDGTERKLPGVTKLADVTLKRGVTGDSTLWTWYEASMQREPQPRDVTLTLLDAKGDVVARYQLMNAWPSKYSLGPLAAGSNEVAVETVEIVYEGLTLDDGDGDD